MPDPKNPPAPGLIAPTGAGTQDPTPEQQREQSKPVESASAAPGEKRSASPPASGRAAESGDPEVHKALADLQTARLNLAAARTGNTAEEEMAAEAERNALARLRELGVEE